MASTTATAPSSLEVSLSTTSAARVAGGNKPPAWALVDLRDDSGPHGEPDRQVPPATAPILVTDGPVSVASCVLPSKPPSMSTPQDFKFLKELGSGSWSTVMEAVHTGTAKRYAVKILSKAQLIRQKKVKYASVEKDCLVKLSGSHPGIVKMYAAFQDETSLYFVLDLAPHGDLADLVKRYGSLSLPCAQWYTAQIVDAVLWIHSKGIVHRDVKPENMLLDSELRVKLTDFGSAYISPDGDLSPRSSTFVGSAAYVSPELLNRSSKTTSSSSDIWAIGCTLYFIVAGTPCFASINDYQSFRKIEALDYTFPEGFYDSAKDLVQKLLVLDPSDRLGVEPKSSPSQLRSHPFFSEPSSLPCTGLPATNRISWEALWTDPPVPPETGIIQPAPSALAADEGDDLWDDMVHEFSLVNVRPPNGGGPVSPLRVPLPPPVDVPPDVVPCEVVETVHPDPDTMSPNGGPAAPDDEDEDADAAALRAKDWSSVVSPDETIRRISSVKTSIRKGLVKQPRPCALLLTSRPRILCVSLDEKHKAPKASDVKHALEVRSQTGGASPPRSPKGEKPEVVVACKIEDPQRKLVVQSGEKDYVYEFADDKALSWWAREISALLGPV